MAVVIVGFAVIAGAAVVVVVVVAAAAAVVVVIAAAAVVFTVAVTSSVVITIAVTVAVAVLVLVHATVPVIVDVRFGPPAFETPCLRGWWGPERGCNRFPIKPKWPQLVATLAFRNTPSGNRDCPPCVERQPS